MPKPGQLATAPPIASLADDERQALLDDLNYLNTAEIKSFCDRHSIPYRIAIEMPDGRRKRAKLDDRKGVILDRIRHLLLTGVVSDETCFPSAVVCLEPAPENLTPIRRLFYGQYNKSNPAMIGLLKDLTRGQFRDGALARILAVSFWSEGKAPTLREYALAWLQFSQEHTKPNPEWAFLSDLSNNSAGPDWKQLRAKKAARVIKLLNRITSGSRCRG